MTNLYSFTNSFGTTWEYDYNFDEGRHMWHTQDARADIWTDQPDCRTADDYRRVSNILEQHTLDNLPVISVRPNMYWMPHPTNQGYVHSRTAETARGLVRNPNAEPTLTFRELVEIYNHFIKREPV
jgi:hypothetical protein